MRDCAMLVLRVFGRLLLSAASCKSRASNTMGLINVYNVSYGSLYKI